MLPRSTFVSQGATRRRAADNARWLIPALAAPALVIVLGLVLPGALVLPALCIILLAAGFALAAIDWLARRPGAVPGVRRDMAAMLVFLGFSAAILTDGQDALRALGEIEAALARRGMAPG